MPTYAVIDENNVVVNVIVWDGVAPYNPEPGCTLQFVPSVDIGRVWDGTDFIDTSDLTTTTIEEV